MNDNFENKKKLDDIIRYAYDHTKYYSKAFDGLITSESTNLYSRIPILTKSIIKNNEFDFLSDDYSIDKLDVERTSGSTGNILNVYWDKFSKIRSFVPLWNKRKIYGITPTSKACFFHTIYDMVIGDNKIITSPKVIYKNDGNVISFSKLNFDDDDMLEYYYEKILEFKPEWFMCHSTTMYLFTKFMIHRGYKPFSNLKLIELTGEMLNEVQRDYIHNFFDVPVVNHYGMRECNGIAYECEYGKLHIIDRNVYVEICDELGNPKKNGEKGIIFITNLTNKAMPIIKYKTDDIGTMYDEICSCGSQKILDVSGGRLNDMINRINKSPLEGNIFFYVIEYINCFYYNTIEQFKIVQEDYDYFTVYLVLSDKAYLDEIKELFVFKCKEIGIDNCNWNFKVVEIIIPESNGKFRYFISEIINM